MQSGVGFLSAAALLAAASIVGSSAAQLDDRLCADQNADGLVTPTDFSAWINNFNQNSPVADVNGDGVVSPTDFTAWIQAFNAGAGGPTCDVVLTDASRVVSAIDFDGDVDVYRLFADTGDDLLVAAGEETTQFSVRVSLRSPSDVELDAGQSNDGFKVEASDVPETGYYSLVVSGTPARTGLYALTAVRIGGTLPAGVALQPGVPITSDIEFGDIDVFRVTIPPGDSLTVAVTEDDGGFATEARLYAPDGELIDAASSDLLSEVSTPSPAVGGTYVVLVSSTNGDTVGTYTVNATITP